MVTGAGYHYPDFLSDTETVWLEQAREEEPGGHSPCCARCRRGTRAHGTLPCGYKLACPNRCHG